MKALIRKCSLEKSWYKDKVGEYLEVLQTEEYVKKGTYTALFVEQPGNDERNTAVVLKEDCLVFKDEDMDKVQAAFDKLEKTLQKLSLQ